MFRLSQLFEYSFVHIIAQPRSGSTALHSYVMPNLGKAEHQHGQGPYRRHQILGEGITLKEDLSEPFNIFSNKNSIEQKTIQAQLLCRDIKQHTQRYVCMKNLINDVKKFDKNTQDLLFNLPGITIGLYRHNTFDQTCSVCIMEAFMKSHPEQPVGIIKQDQYISLKKQNFLRNLSYNIGQKQLMHSIADRFDVMVSYEEIEHQFPPRLTKWKNPPHSHTIINHDKVVVWYNEYMQKAGLHKKVTHKGINFIINKA